jgi:hypothetical protein
MLSAHDFVPLETLPKYLNSHQEIVYDETKATISYEYAVKCLIAAMMSHEIRQKYSLRSYQQFNDS